MSPVKRVLVAVVLVVLCLPVVAFLVLRAELRSLTLALDADVDAYSRRRIERSPPPVTPKHHDGFACLGAMLDVTPRDMKPFSEIIGDLDAIVAGKAPVPAELSDRAAALAAWGRSLRECSQSAYLSYTDGVSPFADEKHPRFKRWNVVMALGRLTVVELAQRLGAGRADEALDLCTQTLPLYFDLTHLGLLGAMLGVSGSQRLAPQCAAALAQATPEARRRAAAEWKQLGSRIAGNPEVLEAERLLTSMLVFQAVATGPADRPLPVEALPLAAAGPFVRVAVAALWGRWDKALRRLVAVSGSPGPERLAASRAIDALLTEWWVPEVVGGLTPEYEKFLVRLDETRATWEFLVQLAEGGPHSPPAFARPVEGGYELTLSSRDKPLFLAAPAGPPQGP
jgi:hypothetical protein